MADDIWGDDDFGPARRERRRRQRSRRDRRQQGETARDSGQVDQGREASAGDAAVTPRTAASRPGRPRPARGGEHGSNGAGGGERQHRAGGGISRAPIILVLGVLLIVGGLVDRAGGSPQVARPALAAAHAQPVGAPSDALSSSWFCGGATDNSGGLAPGQAVIANAGTSALTASVTLLPSTGKPVTQQVQVGPLARVAVNETVPSGAPWIGAVVDLDGGGATVEQQTNSSLGVSATPCATQGSAQWYFSSGETYINASTEITLVNPYSTIAIADMSFTTEQGEEQPSEFRGLEVPADSILTVNLGDHLRRRDRIATTITTRTGRVIAWETQIVTAPPAGALIAGTPAAAAAANSGGDPYLPQAGVTVLLGAPSAGPRWYWPDGESGNGITEQYVIYNPGSATAKVQLALQLAQGSAEPFELTVGPGAVTTLESSTEARIPAGVAHSAVLTSTNGVPVVAERTVQASSPSTRSGVGALLGSRASADNWLLGAGSASSSQDDWVVLYNPGTKTAQVALGAVGGGALKPVTQVSVPAGQQTAVQVNDHDASLDAGILVQSSSPVVAEHDLYGAGSTPGVSLAIGVPLS